MCSLQCALGDGNLVFMRSTRHYLQTRMSLEVLQATTHTHSSMSGGADMQDVQCLHTSWEATAATLLLLGQILHRLWCGRLVVRAHASIIMTARLLPARKPSNSDTPMLGHSTPNSLKHSSQCCCCGRQGQQRQQLPNSHHPETHVLRPCCQSQHLVEPCLLPPGEPHCGRWCAE